MTATVQYSSLNPISPEYPLPIIVDDTLYSSPAAAIESGKDPEIVMAIHVASNRGLYLPYRDHHFIGSYSQPLEKMVHEILQPQMESRSVDRWILMPLGTSYRAPSITMPYITVLRPVMVYDHLPGGLLKPRFRLDPPVMEEYRVYGIEDGVLLYVGAQGMFLLLDNQGHDVNHILDSLRGNA